jgi:hypothetical protein
VKRYIAVFVSLSSEGFLTERESWQKALLLPGKHLKRVCTELLNGCLAQEAV